MTLISKKMLISSSGFMPNSHKKSWTVSMQQVLMQCSGMNYFSFWHKKGSIVRSMFFYSDFILILSWFYKVLYRYYPDFIQILSRFYPDFIQIFSKLTYIQILFR